ncbi:hypothetical protein Lser_V15G43684 [Lactuca serriola]
MEGTKIVTEVGPSCSRSRSPDYHRRNRRGGYDDDYDDERSPSRSPIRSRSPPRRSRSPSRSRSPEGGGNEKASTSSPYSHGRADSRSPLQRSDSNGLPGPMGLMSTSHLEQEAAVLALSTLMTIAPAEVYAEFEKVTLHRTQFQLGNGGLLGASNNLVERTYESDINGNKFNTRVHTIRC